MPVVHLTLKFSCKHATTIAAKPHPKSACQLQRSLDSGLRRRWVRAGCCESAPAPTTISKKRSYRADRQSKREDPRGDGARSREGASSEQDVDWAKPHLPGRPVDAKCPYTQ